MHFRHSAVTKQAGDSGLTLNIWQHVIMKYTKKALFTRLLRRYPGSEQYAIVGVLVKFKWFDFNKEGCFFL
jgi:hypothetical protein